MALRDPGPVPSVHGWLNGANSRPTVLNDQPENQCLKTRENPCAIGIKQLRIMAKAWSPQLSYLSGWLNRHNSESVGLSFMADVDNAEKGIAL